MRADLLCSVKLDARRLLVRGHTHPKGRTTGHEPWWGQQQTEPRIRPFSWHSVFPLCQEPEELSTSFFCPWSYAYRRILSLIIKASDRGRKVKFLGNNFGWLIVNFQPDESIQRVAYTYFQTKIAETTLKVDQGHWRWHNLTGHTYVSFGVRQGSVLSPFLFNIIWMISLESTTVLNGNLLLYMPMTFS